MMYSQFIAAADMTHGLDGSYQRRRQENTPKRGHVAKDRCSVCVHCVFEKGRDCRCVVEGHDMKVLLKKTPICYASTSSR